MTSRMQRYARVASHLMKSRVCSQILFPSSFSVTSVQSLKINQRVFKNASLGAYPRDYHLVYPSRGLRICISMFPDDVDIADPGGML